MNKLEHSAQGKLTAKIVNRAVPNRDAAVAFLLPNLLRETTYDSYPAAIRNSVNFDYLREIGRAYTPWLDIDLYMQQFMRLSDKYLCANVFQTATPEEMKSLTQAFNARSQDGEELISPDEVSEKVSKHNGKFYGYLPVLALTAVFGKELIQTRGSGSVFNAYLGKISSAEAVIDAAEFFGTPAASLEELKQRIATLFPPQNTENLDHSAYSFLQRNKAFHFKNKDGFKDCIVQDPTLHFFEALGQSFQSNFGEVFAKRIESREIKVQRENERRARLVEEKARKEWEQRRRSS